MSDAGAQGPDTASPCEEPGSAGSVADHIQFRIVYGRNSKLVSRSPQHTVRELKREIEEHTGVVVPNQKLLCKTQLRDHQTLSEAGVKQGSKIMVLAIRPQSSPATPQTAEGSTEHAWDPTPAAEVWADQERHRKVLESGRPEGGWVGIADRQVPLDDNQAFIPALLTQARVKVRLTFKPELQQVWLGSDHSTQKVPYSSVRGIISQPIPASPGYSILCLSLGSGSSQLWLYWVPSQAVSGIKLRVLGVQSLL
ncbi:hypothetical protein ACKKBG_A13470 [Auxenochlorella protothecoides x Auxenochlorella symbiontica]